MATLHCYYIDNSEIYFHSKLFEIETGQLINTHLRYANINTKLYGTEKFLKN